MYHLGRVAVPPSRAGQVVLPRVFLHTCHRLLGHGNGSRGSSALDSRGKEKVVVLGVGWGGFRVAKDLDKSKFDVSIVSPRNHFLFTPLLPSTTVGTLEFRCVQEPARTIAGVHYHQARATAIDLEARTVRCTDVFDHADTGHLDFELPYDRLVVAVGTKSNTFGIPGVESREEALSPTGTSRKSVFFLKQLEHARSIRNRIIECFERAASPFVSEEERRRLLTFVIVGGGPTSIEFTSELCDFVQHDVTKWYKDLESDYRVIVVEAGGHLLGTFDQKLSSYVENTLQKRNVILKTNETVKEVRDISVVLGKSGEEIPFGVCVWSTGNSPLEFVKRSDLPLTKDNRIAVDECLRARLESDPAAVYALGDCASNPDNPLPMLAQVANQQGAHLALCMNRGRDAPFKYRFLGMMTSLGLWRGIADFGGAKMKGFTAFLAWRSAYWTMSVSITNKILIPMYWFKSYFFGRDISKF